MVPGLVGRIAELLASIDQKLDKVNVAPIPTDDTPELMNVKELGRYLPSHPAPATIYGWIREHSIPHYKQGKTLMFKKSEIDKWLLRILRILRTKVANICSWNNNNIQV